MFDKTLHGETKLNITSICVLIDYSHGIRYSSKSRITHYYFIIIV